MEVDKLEIEIFFNIIYILLDFKINNSKIIYVI